MTLKKLLLAGSLAALVYWVTGLLINVLFLQSYTQAHTQLGQVEFTGGAQAAVRPGAVALTTIVSSFFSGLLLAFVFLTTNVTHKIAGGLRGAVIGLFFKAGLNITIYANTYLFDTRIIIVDAAFFVLQSILAGIVTAVVVSRINQPTETVLINTN